MQTLLSFDFIKDAKIKKFYEDFSSEEPNKVILEGEKILPQVSDKLAVLEAMRQSAENIISDFAEHGEGQSETWGGKGVSYFKNYKADIEKRIKELASAGAKSTVFSEYKRQRGEKMEKAASEFVAEMDQEEKLVEEMNKASTEPEAVIEVLKKISKLPVLRPEIASTLNAFVNNLLLSLCQTGSFAKAMDVTKAFVEANKDNKFSAGEYFDQLVSHALAAPELANDSEGLRFVIDNLVPKDLSRYPQVFYNLACGYAMLGKKEEMLEAVRGAKQIGKKEKEFLSDSSFKDYIKDSDFMVAIKG